MVLKLPRSYASCNVNQLYLTTANAMHDNELHDGENLASKILNSGSFSVIFPAAGWILAWNTQLFITDFFFVPDYLSVIYFTSGIQICSAILFGFRGIVASVIGSVIAFEIFPNAHYPASVLQLCLLSVALSVIAYFSVELVRRLNHLNDNFENASWRNLVTIVVLYNLISTFSHYVWTTYVSHDLYLPQEYVALSFVSRIVGSFIVMYSFMSIFSLLMRIRVKE